MKTLLARWIANRLESRARALRRSLRDYQRREYAYISELDERLRLYAAWRRESAAYTPEVPERWELTQITT